MRHISTWSSLNPILYSQVLFGLKPIVSIVCHPGFKLGLPRQILEGPLRKSRRYVCMLVTRGVRSIEPSPRYMYVEDGGVKWEGDELRVYSSVPAQRVVLLKALSNEQL